MPYNPTDAQIAATTPAKVGETEVAPGLDGNIFASGLRKPEVSNFLSYQFPQYTMTAVLERLGDYQPCSNMDWSWFEQDRTRRSAEITAGVAGLPTATLTLTTDVPTGTAVAGDGYFLVNDILRTEEAGNIRVTAVGDSGGFQTITVVKVDGTDFAGTDIANGERVGHSNSAFAESSSAPNGRQFYPTERRAKLNIIRRSCEISGSALTEKTYIDDKSWYYQKEMITMDEFARDRENAIMFNTETPNGAQPQTGEGIVPQVEANGVSNFYTGAVSEADIQDHVRDLMVESPASEFLVLCGADFLTDVQQALSAYTTGGAIDYGRFGENTVGIDIQHYKFLGKVCHFVHYPAFDDAATLPYTGTATADKPNYSNYSLWLNIGKQMGQNIISLKYKEEGGISRKFIYKYVDGVTGYSDSPMASNGDDKLVGHMLSDIGIEVRLLNNHGVLRANG